MPRHVTKHCAINKLNYSHCLKLSRWIHALNGDGKSAFGLASLLCPREVVAGWRKSSYVLPQHCSPQSTTASSDGGDDSGPLALWLSLSRHRWRREMPATSFTPPAAAVAAASAIYLIPALGKSLANAWIIWCTVCSLSWFASCCIAAVATFTWNINTQTTNS